MPGLLLDLGDGQFVSAEGFGDESGAQGVPAVGAVRAAGGESGFDSEAFDEGVDLFTVQAGECVGAGAHLRCTVRGEGREYRFVVADNSPECGLEVLAPGVQRGEGAGHDRVVR